MSGVEYWYIDFFFGFVSAYGTATDNMFLMLSQMLSWQDMTQLIFG